MDKIKEFIKRYKIKDFCIKNKLILIIAVIVITLITVGFLLFSKKPADIMKDKVLKNEDFKYNLSQGNIQVEKAVTVSNFSIRYHADSNKWFLEMTFKNNSSEEVNLNNYVINAYNNNNKVVKEIEASILGTLSPNEKRGLTIESKKDISSVTKVLIEEKKEQDKDQEKKK